MEYEGGETSFVVGLPNKIDGIDEIIEKFKDPLAIHQALKDMKYEKVKVYLPKFKIETTSDLGHVLEQVINYNGTITSLLFFVRYY